MQWVLQAIHSLDVLMTLLHEVQPTLQGLHHSSYHDLQYIYLFKVLQALQELYHHILDLQYQGFISHVIKGLVGPLLKNPFETYFHPLHGQI